MMIDVAIESTSSEKKWTLGSANHLVILTKLKNQLQSAMANYFIIRHSKHQLKLVENEIEEIEVASANFNAAYNSIELHELKNMILVAKQIILAAHEDCMKTTEVNCTY